MKVPVVNLPDVAAINPRFCNDIPGSDEAVAFVPMAAVSAERASVEVLETRQLSTVVNGFTYFQDGDILVAKITPCFENGKIAQARITQRHGFGSTEFHVVRPEPNKLDARFLLHFLRQPRIRLEGERRMTGSAGQRRVPKHFLQGLEIPLPSLTDQRRISAILDKADDLRARRRNTLSKLNTLTQFLFLDTFGDPLTNPRGWRSSTLGDELVFQQYGPRFFNERYVANGVRIVRITDLDEAGSLDFSRMPMLAVSDEDIEKYALRPGDIIFARTGATVGKVALISEGAPICIAGAYFITMRFSPAIEPIYARAVLTSPSIRSIVGRRSQQSAQQNFSGPGLRALPMPVPPRDLQRDFAHRASAVERVKAAQLASLTKLDALFASLQHRAFRGDL